MTITIYNLLGQEIMTLVDEVKAPGTYEVVWEGRNEFGIRMGSGVYFYRLTTQRGFVDTKKMVLMR